MTTAQIFDKSTIETRLRADAITVQKVADHLARVYLFSFPCYETFMGYGEEGQGVKSKSVGFLIDSGERYLLLGHDFEQNAARAIKITLRDMKIGRYSHELIPKTDLVRIFDSDYLDELDVKIQAYKPEKADFAKMRREIIWV